MSKEDKESRKSVSRQDGEEESIVAQVAQTREKQETEYAWNKHETFTRLHKSIFRRTPYCPQDRSWMGVIRINKPVHLLVTDDTDERRVVPIDCPANEDFEANRIILELLMYKAVQEGPLSMAKEWDNSDGNSVDKNPLKIAIIKEYLDKNSAIAYGKSSDPRRIIGPDLSA